MTVIKIPSLEKGLAQAELSIDEYWLIYSIIFAQRISLDSDPFNNGGYGSIYIYTEIYIYIYINFVTILPEINFLL